jgi:NADPH:quinone reductase-like Zn-dependent oxidoreductase
LLKNQNSSFEEADGLPLTGSYSNTSIRDVGIKGDRILIHAGSGGVGSLQFSMLKLKGAIVYTQTAKDWVKALGADR